MKGNTTWSQKRKIAPVAAAVGVALIAAACGSSSSASTTTQGGSAGTATNKAPIVVGLAAPLTG
ncbi:MAG: ABC transporter substrate-binding protein, partial [Actinomycetota bacterium]|nr:ABC transporter substrate-binding protein [Actinomycetota bacterium]